MNDAMLHKRGLEPNVAGDQVFSKPNTGGRGGGGGGGGGGRGRLSKELLRMALKMSLRDCATDASRQPETAGAGARAPASSFPIIGGAMQRACASKHTWLVVMACRCKSPLASALQASLQSNCGQAQPNSISIQPQPESAARNDDYRV